MKPMMALEGIERYETYAWVGEPLRRKFWLKGGSFLSFFLAK
jgi:hypothetical protein